MYTRKQQVVATVESTYSFGAFVRLPDGDRAYIRRREASLSGDADPRDLFPLGKPVKAIVIELAGPDRMLELSVRQAKPDPWQEFARRQRLGDVVAATVKKVTPAQLLVQVIPGVDGVIPLTELAAWPVTRPADLVWSGDHLEAVITQLDPNEHRLQLSVRRRLEQLDQVQAIMAGLQRQAEPSVDALPESEPTPSPEPASEGDIAAAGPVLVIEDSAEVREPLVKWLNDRGCPASGAPAAREVPPDGLPPGCRLLIIDLDMPEVDGLSFVQALRSQDNSIAVAVMSGPELIAEKLPLLQALKVTAVFPKPLDMAEVQRTLAQFGRGELQPLAFQESTPAAFAEHQPFQELAEVMRSRLSLAERFHQGLAFFQRETRAESALLFHLDPVRRQVEILAEVGEIPLHHAAIPALLDSPVRDVIEDRQWIFESRASQDRVGRFRRLRSLLGFEACIGVPLLAGGKSEHALFIFHREPESFSRYRLRDALAMATLLGVALENQALDERIQALSGIFLSGQLAAGFGHEVYNKLSGLDLQFRNLRFDVGQLGHARPQLKAAEDYQGILYALDGAIETAGELKQAVAGFRRLMEAREEHAIDINHLLRQAEVQLRPQARRENVEMRLELSDNLPPANGSSTGLQQVCLNLMLNAIQHLAAKPHTRRALVMRTTCAGPDDPRPIKVRFEDNGPGIHRQLWERIFELGFTTREGGSGLGLFIARSLTEFMGGAVRVEKSLIPLGTTFLVELAAK